MFWTLPAVTLIEENPVRSVIISGKYFRHGRVQAVDDVGAMLLYAGDALLRHEHWNQKRKQYFSWIDISGKETTSFEITRVEI